MGTRTRLLFAVTIELQDAQDDNLLTASVPEGLYLRFESLTVNAAVGQKEVTMASTSKFPVGGVVNINDGAASEVNTIASKTATVLTMVENLQNTYTTGASAKVNGNSSFRWIEALVSSLSSDFTEGVLGKEFASPLEQAADLRRGGAIVQVGGLTILRQNVGSTNNQFWEYLDSNNIELLGLKITLVEFELNDGGTPLVDDGEVRFTGIIQKTDWTETDYIITAEDAHYKRITNIATSIDNDLRRFQFAEASSVGKIIPASFGEIIDAKLIRTNNRQEVFVTDDEPGVMQLFPSGLQSFPIFAQNNVNRTFSVSFDFNTVSVDTAVIESRLLNEFCIVSEGKGKGQIRKVVAITVTEGGNTAAAVTVEAPYPDGLSLGAADHSFIEFYAVDKTYEADDWPLKDFLDEDFNPVGGTEIELSSETDGVPSQFPPYALQVLENGTRNNKIEVEPLLFNGSFDSVLGYLFKPSGSFTKFGSNFGTSNADPAVFPGQTAVTAGLVNFGNWFTNGNQVGDAVSSGSGGLEDQSDKDETTFRENINQIRINLTVGEYVFQSSTLYLATIKLPKNFDFKQLYIAIKEDVTLERVSGTKIDFDVKHHLSTEKFNVIGVTQVLEKLLGSMDGDPALTSQFMDNLPDFYLTVNNPSTNNEAFFRNLDTNLFLRGLANFIVPGVTSKSILRTLGLVSSIVSFFAQDAEDATYKYGRKIYELVLIFESANTLKNVLHSNMIGRIFNDTTFATRYGKTSTDKIDNAVAVAEHILRLQNWEDRSLPPSVQSDLASNAAAAQKDVVVDDANAFRVGDALTVIDDAAQETGEIDTIDLVTNTLTLLDDLVNAYTTAANARAFASRRWGVEYGANPGLYEGSGQGQLDSPTLDELKTNTTPIRQITSLSSAYTDKALKSICREYFMASFQASNGLEGISNLVQTLTPATTITLDDILGRIGKLIEPEIDYMFAEPFVRYKKNHLTDDFDEFIRVTKVSQRVFQPSFVTGLTGGEAENLWNDCRNIYLRCRQLATPPQEYTDLEWITTLTDAKRYITTWVQWMTKKRITFSVPYNMVKDTDRVRDWFVSYHFNLQLPFHTDDVVLECLVERITKDKFNNEIMISAILLDDVPQSDFIQDTFDGDVDFQDEFALPIDIQDIT